MPNICAIPGCTERRNTFLFPICNPALNEKWIHFVAREGWKPSKHSVLCMKHFESKFNKDCGVPFYNTLLW